MKKGDKDGSKDTCQLSLRKVLESNHVTLLLTSHKLELSHMAIPSGKGCWEMQFLFYSGRTLVQLKMGILIQ